VVDVQIPRFASATLIGRIDSANVFEDRAALYPSGYIWNLNADRHWELLSTRYNRPTVALANGDAGDLSSGWRHLGLNFHG
jgi:hypothetical protein